MTAKNTESKNYGVVFNGVGKCVVFSDEYFYYNDIFIKQKSGILDEDSRVVWPELCSWEY